MALLVKDVLAFIGQKGEVTSTEVAKALSEDHQKIVGAVKSILTFPEVSFSRRDVELLDSGVADGTWRS